MPTPSGSKRILIVEDDVEQQYMVRLALESAGYNVVTAESAHQALAQARWSVSDLVLLDIAIPGVDGLEVLTRLKANHATHSIPVIIVSALSGEARIKRAQQSGATDYITKPCPIPELLSRVERALAFHEAHGGEEQSC